MKSRSSVFAISIAGLVLIAGLGAWGHVNNGFPNRFSPEARAILSMHTDRIDRTCHFDENRSKFVPKQACHHTVPDASGDVLLFGDSHVAAIWPQVVTALNESGRNVYVGSYGGCIPLPNMEHVHKSSAHECAEFVDAILTYADEIGIDTLVLAARFPAYLHGTRFDNGEGGVEHGTRMDVRDLGATSHAGQFDLLRSKLEGLAQRFNLVLVEPIPEAGWNVPELIAKRMHFAGSDDQSLSTDYSVYTARTKPVIAAFEAVQQHSQNVRIAPIHTRFCDFAMGRCANANSTDVLYLDGDHPSDAGAALIALDIVQAVASLPPR